jgi:hypothetical protein
MSGVSLVKTPVKGCEAEGFISTFNTKDGNTHSERTQSEEVPNMEQSAVSHPKDASMSHPK